MNRQLTSISKGLPALGTLLAESEQRYCHRVGVDRELVEPLFYTCWLDQALKESVLVPAEALVKAHYSNLLRMSIRKRHGAALTSLFDRLCVSKENNLSSKEIAGIRHAHA